MCCFFSATILNFIKLVKHFYLFIFFLLMGVCVNDGLPDVTFGLLSDVTGRRSTFSMARLQEIHCVSFSSGHSTNERSCLEAGLEIDLLRSPNQPLTQSGSCQQCHHLLHPHICWGFFSTVLLGRVFMTSFLFFGPCFHT